MPHKMNCSNQLLENDQKVVCRKAYHKKYAKNRERILAQQKRWLTGNIEILKNGCKKWYENNKERLVSSQRVLFKTTRNTSQITKDNTTKTTGNG